MLGGLCGVLGGGVVDAVVLLDEDEDSSDELSSSSFHSSAYSRLLLSTQQQVHSQYRLCHLLEPYLRQPLLLCASPPTLQLPPTLLSSLTALYYSIEPNLALLLCSLKFKALTRSDVDLLSQRAALKHTTGWRLYVRAHHHTHQHHSTAQDRS